MSTGGHVSLFLFFSFPLIHCGIVAPCGDINLGQYCSIVAPCGDINLGQYCSIVAP